MLQIATSLLKALCKEVVLDVHTYKAYAENEQLPQAFVSHLGIGDSYSTWHGTPDAQCRAEGVITRARHKSRRDSLILKGKRLEAGIIFPNFWDTSFC